MIRKLFIEKIIRMQFVASIFLSHKFEKIKFWVRRKLT